MACRTIPELKAIICDGGKEYRIKIDGEIYLFEMHPACGPLPMNRNRGGRNLGLYHPFWKAVSSWHQQGKRVDRNNSCLWEKKQLEGLPRPLGKSQQQKVDEYVEKLRKTERR